MAIYHLNARTGNRGHDGTGRRGQNKQAKAGQSAAAKHAYICRIGRYGRDASEVLFSESGNMPNWAADDAGIYWDAADCHERANGRLFKEVEFALPRELTLEQQVEAIRAFADHLGGDENLPFTYAVHAGRGTNPHCHLMLNERINDGIERTAETWFKRYNAKKPHRGGAQKTASLKPKNWLEQTRAVWSELANDALARHGHDQRIDHRTLAEQGADRLPQVHIGPNVAAMTQRGILTDRWERFEAVNESNALRTEETALELEIAVAADALDSERRQETRDAEAHALDIQPPATNAGASIPDDPAPAPGVDDQLTLARQSLWQDAEDRIGRQHWLQIRADRRALERAQQRLDEEREEQEEREWQDWVSQPGVCSATGRLYTENAVDVCIQRERALPQNQPPAPPPRRMVPWPPKHDPVLAELAELAELKRAAAKRAAAPAKPRSTAETVVDIPDEVRPAPERVVDIDEDAVAEWYAAIEREKALPESESRPPAPAEPTPQARPEPTPTKPEPEPTFDAEARAREIIKMPTADERAGAFREVMSDMDMFDALYEALEPFMIGLTGELLPEGERLRAELLPEGDVQRAERDQGEPVPAPRTGPDGPGF